MNSGGSRKTTSSAYGNIGGSRKQIYPASITYTYKWNRYYIASSGGGVELYTYSSNTTLHVNDPRGIQYSSSYVLENASFEPYDSGLPAGHINRWRFTITSATSKTISLGYTPSGYWYVSNMSSGYIGYQGHEPIVYTSNGSFYDVSDTEGTAEYNEVYAIDVATYHYREKAAIESAGSYIDQVSSTTRNAYPDNGSDGTYWYIYQGAY